MVGTQRFVAVVADESALDPRWFIYVTKTLVACSSVDNHFSIIDSYQHIYLQGVVMNKNFTLNFNQ